MTAPETRDGRTVESIEDAYETIEDEYDGPTVERPVDRSIDAEQFVPTDDGFVRELSADFASLLHTPARQSEPFLIRGPSGAGLAGAIRGAAAHEDVPVVTVRGDRILRKEDVVGTDTLVDGQLLWEDGAFLRAAAIAEQRPVVLHIEAADTVSSDEVRDALVRLLLPSDEGIPTGENATMSDPYKALENANAANILCILTEEPAPSYAVETNPLLPLATRTLDIDYMDERHEAAVVKEKTPINTRSTAKAFVQAMNTLRKMELDNRASNEVRAEDIRMGTPSLLKWVDVAYHLQQHGGRRPNTEAAVQVLPTADASAETRDTISQVVLDHLYGVDIGDS